MRLTIGNLKGGVGKTTTAVYLATLLAHNGRTLLVDADAQASALDWSQAAHDLPCTVIPWATPDLAKRVQQVAGDYQHVVIDTGPGADAILRQALLVTDQLIVPSVPAPLDLRRLPPTFALAAEVDAISAVTATALLTRVRAGTRAPGDARAVLADMSLPVCSTEIHLWESYAMTWGTTPTDTAEYTHVLAELTQEVAA